MNRRGALKLFGMAPVMTKKLAGKLASDAAIGQLAGISAVNHGSPSEGVAPSGGPHDWKVKLKQWLKLKEPIPAWWEDNIRARCQFVHSIDIDIANKKSWSMAVKVATQRERNVQRELKALERNMWLDDQRDAFYEKWGIWL